MIKIGKLTQSAINRDFPKNWQALAIMMNLEYEMLENDTIVSIQIDEHTFIDITSDNTITSSAPLPKEAIAAVISSSIEAKRKAQATGSSIV